MMRSRFLFVWLALASLVAAMGVLSPGPFAMGGPRQSVGVSKARTPRIDRPVMFNTPEADAICSAPQVYPPDHPLNLSVEDWPVHPNSKAIVASVGVGKPLRYNTDMAFVLVPPNQKRVPVKVVAYPGESDPGCGRMSTCRGSSPEVQAILKGLKTYGMLVADNGIEWAISCTPDPRIPVLHEELRKVKGADFVVVVPPADRRAAK